MSPEAQFFISAEERETWCVSTVHSSLRSRCHPLYMKVFSSFWFVTGAPFKKKTKQKQTKKNPYQRAGMSAPWRWLCSAWMVSLSCHHRQLLLHRSVGLDRISSQVRGTEDSGRWSPTPPKLQKKHLQQQSSCVLYQKLSRMCVVFPKKQYLVSSICTAEPRVCACIPDPRQRRSVFAVFPSPWFFYRCYQMQRCWPFWRGLPICFVFFTWFCMKKKTKLVLYTNPIFKKKEKKKRN